MADSKSTTDKANVAEDKALLAVDDDKAEAEIESEISGSDDDEEDEGRLSDPAAWDITFKLAQFLDNHFILALLQHLHRQRQRADAKGSDDADDSKSPSRSPMSAQALQLMSLYGDEDLNRLAVSLLSKTCMVDEQLALFSRFSEQLCDARLSKQRDGLATFKTRVVAQLTALEEQCGPLLDLLGDNEQTAAVDWVTSQNFDIDALFAYCRLRYEVGFYQHTDVLLAHYRRLTPDPAKKSAALWGALSAQILQNKWDDAFKSVGDIGKLIEDASRTMNLSKADEAEAEGAQAEEEKEEDIYTKMARLELEGRALDDVAGSGSDAEDAEAKRKSAEAALKKSERERKANVATIMRDRAWLLHWSLFVYLNKYTLLDELIQLFSSAKYMNVIQTMCPHLLRYLTAAIVISPNIDKVQSKLKYLSDVCKSLASTDYADPITEFVRLLIKGNDFAGASKMLESAMALIRCDFFLSYYEHYFLQFARSTFLYKYCRLYNRISVDSVARLLLMDKELDRDEIQLWLINAIRSEDSVHAKLDVVQNVIYVHFAETNPYQEMKDRIKSMNQRTLVVYASIGNKMKQLEEARNEQ